MNDGTDNRVKESHTFFCNRFPWNGNELVELTYGRDNYKIVDLNCQSKNVIVFFSGNGLYSPNEEAVFRDRVCNKDRYEWENVSTMNLIQRQYSKIIFVRDIYKQWYVKGINKRINSVEKVIELIRELTYGFEVVTCGNSAGGYMAMLVGRAIGAKKIFSFSGQFSIISQVSGGAPLLDYYKKDNYYSKYYNLSIWLKKSGGVIFHFYPEYSMQDMEQMKILNEIDYEELYLFAFNEKRHGRTVEFECYEYLLTMELDRLIELSQKYGKQLIKASDFLNCSGSEYV